VDCKQAQSLSFADLMFDRKNLGGEMSPERLVAHSATRSFPLSDLLF
jgi:hypothetical protein